jgi:hypothetical protein
MSNLPEAASGKRVIVVFLVLFVICAALVLGAGMLPWRDWVETGGSGTAPASQTQPTQTPSGQQ